LPFVRERFFDDLICIFYSSTFLGGVRTESTCPRKVRTNTITLSWTRYVGLIAEERQTPFKHRCLE
jgi:hypothetical protein